MTACRRCSAPVPSETVEGVTWRTMLEREHRSTSRRYLLRVQRWWFRWMPEDPRDQVTMSHTAVELCPGCVGELLAWTRTDDLVRSVAELEHERLPVGSAVLDDDGAVWQLREAADVEWWQCAADDVRCSTSALESAAGWPLRVLFVAPEPS